MLIRHIDLFCGVGGFRIGIQNACKKHQAEYQCVFSSDIKKVACEVYKENFGEYPSGDITQIEAKDVPDCEVLSGGFPCQAFSHLGIRKGLEDTRGTLIFEILRIAKEKRPRFLFLENVKGLADHDGGKTWEIMQNAIEEIGYHFKAEILNSLYYGSAQHRQRIFIICFRDREDYERFYHPLPTTLPGDFKTIEDILSPKDTVIQNYKGFYKKEILDGLCYGYNRFPISRKTHSSTITTTPADFFFSDDIPIETLKENDIPYPVGVRIFNGRELARLQGFPEDFKLPEKQIECWEIFGNSVTVNVIEAIFDNILKVMEGKQCAFYEPRMQERMICKTPLTIDEQRKRISILEDLGYGPDGANKLSKIDPNNLELFLKD